MSKSFTKTKEKPQILQYVKAIFIAILISLALILAFAFLIKSFDISDKAILPVNIGIKLVSIFFATLVVTRDKKHGMRKGFVVGFVYIVFSFLLFSILSKDFSISIKVLYDLIFGIAGGAICGIICVNIRK